MIKDNISRLKDDIALICRRIGRDPQEIVLVGVTKYAQSSGITEALQNGVEHIAENKIQEAKEKFAAVDFSKYRVTRHMIGHLQTNKVKDALKLFDIIQSVDSLHVAQAIDRQAEGLGKKAEILLQVNTSGEPQKFGVNPRDVLAIVEQIARQKHIRVSGVMAMAPLTDDAGLIRSSFCALRKLRDDINKHFAGAATIQMKFLSMGMSHDYRIAIEEGSNMVRIGSAIFK